MGKIYILTLFTQLTIKYCFYQFLPLKVNLLFLHVLYNLSTKKEKLQARKVKDQSETYNIL